MEKEINLIIQINPKVHKEVKRRALQQDLSMKKWVEEAIKEKINKEIELGWK